MKMNLLIGSAFLAVLAMPLASQAQGVPGGADRTGDAIALIEAMRGAAGNALRLCGERHGEHCEKRATNQQVLFHQVTSV